MGTELEKSSENRAGNILNLAKGIKRSDSRSLSGSKKDKPPNPQKDALLSNLLFKTRKKVLKAERNVTQPARETEFK